MPDASSMVLMAGGVSLAGNFKAESGFPSNGYTIVGATVALTFIASIASKSPVEPAVKAAAGLFLLVACIRYIPGLFTASPTTKVKVKNNG